MPEPRVGGSFHALSPQQLQGSKKDFSRGAGGRQYGGLSLTVVPPPSALNPGTAEGVGRRVVTLRKECINQGSLRRQKVWVQEASRHSWGTAGGVASSPLSRVVS